MSIFKSFIEDRYEPYLVIAFLLIVGLYGGMMNILVLSTNDGRMPVLTNHYINDDTHFNFMDAKEVNTYPLTDRFVLFDFIHFSFGDIIIVFSFTLIICILLLKGINLFRNRRYNYV